MKKTRKKILEKYVDLKCKKLQEQYADMVGNAMNPYGSGNAPSIEDTNAQFQQYKQSGRTNPMDSPHLYSDQEKANYMQDYAVKQASFGASKEELGQMLKNSAESISPLTYMKYGAEMEIRWEKILEAVGTCGILLNSMVVIF